MSEISFRVLSEGQIYLLHQKTLDLLEKVGIKVTHSEALYKLKKAGAVVNDAAGLVKFPRKLVGDLLSLAPDSALCTGLNKKKLDIGSRNRYYMSLILDPFINDYEQGMRLPRLEDVRRHTIIGESLNRISIMMRMQAPVSDVPEPDCYYKTMEVFLSNLTKHVSIYPTSVENCQDWMDAYEVIADAAGVDVKKTPFLSVAMAVTSPLQIHGINVDIMKLAMERCYPIISTVCNMAGTTSPYSVAGTALVSNVEALLPVLISQVYKPGHPVLYGFGASVTDMRSGHDLYYKAEKMLWKSIACQMGKFYNLPISGETGGSLTHLPDMQNGAESFAYMLTSHLNGQNLFGGVGSMGNANGMSQEQIVMQCGLIDMAEYIAKGVDMSEHKLAFDSIQNIGPGGNFLTEDLTIELLKSDEFFDSPFFDVSGGYIQNAKGMYDIAHEKANELVSNYKCQVPEKIQVAIKDFFRNKYNDKNVADI